MQICTQPEPDKVASVTKRAGCCAAMLFIPSPFRLLCAPSRQWPAAESRGPEPGWPQNLAAVGRVACDLPVPVPVLVLFEGLSFLLCFFRTPAVWLQQCGLFFSFNAAGVQVDDARCSIKACSRRTGGRERGQARHAAACQRLVRIKASGVGVGSERRRVP